MSNCQIEDFAEFDIAIEGERYPLYGSHDSGVTPFFEQELASTRSSELDQVGAYLHRVSIGDEIILGNKGDRYIVKNVTVEYHPKHPHADSKQPFISVKILVRKA